MAPQYNCPITVLKSERDVEDSDKGRIGSWSLGCILYLLNTGKPAFPNLSSLMDYNYSGLPAPQLLGHENPKLMNFPTRELADEEKPHLSMMWNSIRGHLIGDKDFDHIDRESQLYQVNEMIAKSFNRDISERPSINQIEIHAAANVVAGKLEESSVVSQAALD
jgi:serine/threonine protein kinase